MRGSSLRNLKMFKELIGDSFHANVTLGTTCWSLVPYDVAVAREGELKGSSAFWKTLLANGARLERVPSGVEEARELVYRIARHEPVPLQTQHEIVDLGRAFETLAVAKMVDCEVEEVRRKQAAEVARVKAHEEAASARAEKVRNEELERARESNRRIEGFRGMQARCVRKKPFGVCDKPGCGNKLQAWKVTWRKFSLPFLS